MKIIFLHLMFFLAIFLQKRVDPILPTPWELGFIKTAHRQEIYQWADLSIYLLHHNILISLIRGKLHMIPVGTVQYTRFHLLYLAKIVLIETLIFRKVTAGCIVEAVYSTESCPIPIYSSTRELFSKNVSWNIFRLLYCYTIGGSKHTVRRAWLR
jgi:hypothetical protein